jgi:hypothetical protein
MAHGRVGGRRGGSEVQDRSAVLPMAENSMSIVRRLLTQNRPAAQADSDLAVELARLHDLRRAGILSAAESKAIRTHLLVDASHRHAA